MGKLWNEKIEEVMEEVVSGLKLEKVIEGEK